MNGKEEQEEKKEELDSPKQDQLTYLKAQMQPFLNENPEAFQYIIALFSPSAQQSNDCELYAYKLLFLFGKTTDLARYLQRVKAMNIKKEEYMQYIDLKLPESKDENTIKGLRSLLRKIADDPSLIKNIVYHMDALKKKIIEEPHKSFGKKGENRWVKAFQLPQVTKAYLAKFLVTQIYPFITDETLEDGFSFSKHHVSADFLQAWLTLKENVPNEDPLLLPETLLVDGASINQNEFSIVFIHRKDPRRAVLGHITGCCETIDTGAHVHEDTLSKVGILALTKDNQDRLQRLHKAKAQGDEQEDYDQFHLSKACKDEDIIGFMRVYISKDEKNLVIDMPFIRLLIRKNKEKLKKIIAMIAKFSEIFLSKNPEIDAVWIGSETGYAGGMYSYFITRPSGNHLEPPEGMVNSESKYKRLMCNRTVDDLYTNILHSPELVLRLDKASLAKYANKEELLKKCIIFSNSEQAIVYVDHLLSLMTEEEQHKLNPFQLACEAENIEVICHMIDTRQDLIQPWSKALLAIARASFSVEKKRHALTQLFQHLDEESSLAFIKAQSPEGKENLVRCLLQPAKDYSRVEEDILLLIFDQFKGKEKISLYKDLMCDSLMILENKQYAVLQYLFATLSSGLQDDSGLNKKLQLQLSKQINTSTPTKKGAQDKEQAQQLLNRIRQNNQEAIQQFFHSDLGRELLEFSQEHNNEPMESLRASMGDGEYCLKDLFEQIKSEKFRLSLCEGTNKYRYLPPTVSGFFRIRENSVDKKVLQNINEIVEKLEFFHLEEVAPSNYDVIQAKAI